MPKSVAIKNADKKGKGVFVMKNFKKGEVIFVNRRGKFLKESDLKRLPAKARVHLNEIDYTTWEVMRLPGRFVNHSCDPNAMPKESSKSKVPYVALRGIKKGEEITVDYRINAHDKEKMRCYCGSKNCSKLLTSDFFSLPIARQRKYLPFTPKYIRDTYEQRHHHF